MKSRNSIENLTILIPFAVLFSCVPEIPDHGTKAAALFNIAPDSGSTTTEFRLDAGASLQQGTRDNPVFIRWDW